MNKIHEIYNQTSWKPHFYINPWAPSYLNERKKESDQDMIDIHKEQDIPCFIHHKYYTNYSGENVYPLYNFRLQYPDIPFHQMSLDSVRNIRYEHLLEYWSDDLEHVVYEYHAMYVAVQLAIYLGFEKIYILGADLGRDYRNPHMIFNSGLDPYKFSSGKLSYLLKSVRERTVIQSIINGLAMKLIQQNGVLPRLVSVNDQLHFSSNYDNRLTINDFRKDDEEIRKSHIAIKRICNNRGINVYNATLGGELDIYPRVDLKSVV